jgi:hypothetical protein
MEKNKTSAAPNIIADILKWLGAMRWDYLCFDCLTEIGYYF